MSRETSGAQTSTNLVVFVGGVVLQEDDALTVQTPVVPFPLLEVNLGYIWTMMRIWLNEE